MKTKIVFAGLILISNFLWAQTYFMLPKTGTNNEPEGEYVFTTLGKLVMRGNTTGLADTLSSLQTLPFAWNFYGKAVTGYFISDNGYISFDATGKSSNPNNTSIPDPAAPKSAIFALWDALVQCDPDGPSTNTNLIHTWTYGTAPNRVHVIHWFRAFHEPYTTDKELQFCFGIRLYESGAKAFDIVYDYRYLPSGGTTVNTNATVGCQNDDASQATMITGSPAFNFPTATSDKADDVVYEFYYGTQPARDLSVIDLDINDIAKTNAYLPVKGTIRNFGSDAITSFTLNYRVDGGVTQNELVNSINIIPGETYSFSHADLLNTSATEKNSIVEVWASNLNGSNDQNNLNDTMKATIQVVGTSAVRLPLHEVFTSSTCPPCKPGNEKLDAVFGARPDKYTCVKYQMYFPGTGDPYFTTECDTRSNYYGGISSVPRLEVDGSWNSNPGSYSETIFDQYYDVPSFVSIDARYTVLPYQYDQTDTTVTIDVTVTPHADFIGYNPKVFMAIVESVTYRNVKSNGETEFHNVMKKMVPNANGYTLAKLQKNMKQTVSKTYTFKGKYTLPINATDPINLLSENSVENYNNLLVVVWVQDDISKKVLQSAWAKLPSSSIQTPDMGITAGLYPNPVGDMSTLIMSLDEPQKLTFEVSNMLGQVKLIKGAELFSAGKHSIDMTFSNLEPGNYILLIRSDKGLTTLKFVK